MNGISRFNLAQRQNMSTAKSSSKEIIIRRYRHITDPVCNLPGDGVGTVLLAAQHHLTLSHGKKGFATSIVLGVTRKRNILLILANCYGERVLQSIIRKRYTFITETTQAT